MAGNSNEPWRECVNWLTRCELLRPDHKANWPDASIADLATALRDGVLLCTLLNTLDPGCIDSKDVNQKPQMAQFLCLRNIRTFLKTCREIFGLRENDLFESSMLFDCSDFYKVLSTLSKLSNCPRVQRKRIEGFTIDGDKSQDPEYSILNASTGAISPANQIHSWDRNEPSWMQFTIKSPQFEDREEEIYEDLCYVTFSTPLKEQSNKGEEEPQARIFEYHCDDDDYGYYSQIRHNEEIYQDLCVTRSNVQDSASNHFEKRDYVINELVDTEKNYVEVLATTMRCFVRPLSNQLSREEAQIIFKGLKELSEIHEGFHRQLRKAISPNSTTKLSDAFLQWREKFLIYGEYCANLTTAQGMIEEVCKKSELINQQVIKCQQEANNGKFELRDVLMVPMQRILKYHLLLQRLIGETQPNHEEYRGLERAKEAMLDVTEFINEVKRDTERLALVSVIQDRVIDLALPENTQLKDYGRLVKDGELKIRAHNDQKLKTRWVFVFDKIILMCKPFKNEQCTFRESINLAEYRLEDVHNRRTMARDTRWGYQWLLARKEANVYTMSARTEDNKRKWIKAIQEAMDNIEPQGCRNTDHKFSMHTFAVTTTCHHCSKYLKGTIFQGYKCSMCSIAVHKQCIPLSGRCSREETHAPPPIAPDRTSATMVVSSRTRDFQPTGQDWNLHSDIASNNFLATNVREFLWFVGAMEREKAADLLDNKEDGTYLLRVRPAGPTNLDETNFALSLRADQKVKHMKVYKREINGSTEYFLSQSRYFKSIVELINNYEHTSLGENFEGLDVSLSRPFRQIMVKCEFDFTPTTPNQLQLERGCYVTVISKEGDRKGWWKGRVEGGDHVGFFPKNYVSPVSDSFTSLGISENSFESLPI